MSDTAPRPHAEPGLPLPRGEAERLYAQLFDLAPFPAVVSRISDHTVVAINARTSEMFGVSPRDAVGVPIMDYYFDPAERLRMTEQLVRDGRIDGVRVRVKHADGRPFWVLASSRPITWHGEPAILALFHDISDQVDAEASLKASEHRLATQSDALTALTARYTDPDEPFDERLRSILETSAQALDVERLSMWRFDDERAAIRCIGLYRRADRRYDSGLVLFRHDAADYFAAMERDRVIAANDAHVDPRTRGFTEDYLVPNGIGAMLDVPLRHDNATVGVLCAEHVGGARLWTVDEQNFAISVANLIVVALSEEELRRALARLAQSETRARLIIDTAHDAFVAIDSTGRIRGWNAQAERTFGWRRDEAIDRPLADTIIPPQYREAHAEGLRRFHETGAAPIVNQRLELTALHRSGREFPVEITISAPMGSDEGHFFSAFLRDISDRLARDAELRRAKESAEAATRAKSEFLANMSHELRTPLNGVLGYAQLLQRDRTLNTTQHEALEAIARCGSQLLDLINDILDLSKIEAGRLEIEEAPTDLTTLVADLRYVVAGSADRKGLRLTAFIDPQVPRPAVLDGRRLRQVLLNLLGNAVKFTAAGEVRLSIARTGADHLAFEVADTGPGIEPEALTQIFGAFAQTKAGAAAGGTGLGLAICDRLIRKMGGELEVESVLGRGSRFWFTLPVADDLQPAVRQEPEVEAMPALDARLAPGERLEALVVDDSTANRRILASLLESAGVRVITASSGQEGIDLARAHHPQVVFMDLKMPDIDGFEATRRLARDPLTSGIPVVAVTASTFGDVRQAALEAGCVEYLSKPVRAELLFGLLQTLLGVRFVGGGDPAPSREIVTIDVASRAEIARRLREAIALGDVRDLQDLAQRLLAGGAAEGAIGDRIGRLATEFHFDGLRDLADSLEGSPQA